MPVTERNHVSGEDPKVSNIRLAEDRSSYEDLGVSSPDSEGRSMDLSNLDKDSSNNALTDASYIDDKEHFSTDRVLGEGHDVNTVGQHETASIKSKGQDAVKLMKERMKTSPTRSAPLRLKFDHFGLNYASDRAKHTRLYNSYLRPNSRFIGEQRSEKSKYHIQVEFKTVDLINSLVTGFLQISGLTDTQSEIATCFKGEIINNPLNYRQLHTTGGQVPTQLEPKTYSFATENKSWGSYLKNDLEHWKKLTCSGNLNDTQLKQKLQKIQNGEEDNNYIYMRWKEEFLLPDSRVKQISGASFEGFYYIVLNISSAQNHVNDYYSADTIPGSISGLYYHRTSEKFQSLSLRFVDERKSIGSFEFV